MIQNIILVLFPWLHMITIMFNIQVKGDMGLVERKGTRAKSTKKELGLQKFNPSKWGKNVSCFLNYSGQL
jgi:hypothetical protein